MSVSNRRTQSTFEQNMSMRLGPASMVSTCRYQELRLKKETIESRGQTMNQINSKTIVFLITAISVSIITRTSSAQNDRVFVSPDGWAITLEGTSDGAQRISIMSLLTTNHCASNCGDLKDSFYFLFPMTTEKYWAIRRLYDEEVRVRDQVAEATMVPFKDEVNRLIAQGVPEDDEQFGRLAREGGAAMEAVYDEFYRQGELRNELIAKMLDEDELEKLRRGALNMAMMVKGGLGGLYEYVIKSRGLGLPDNPRQKSSLTPEQRRRIFKLRQEYLLKLKELNVEYGERLLEMLPPEEKEAMIDFIGTRGLEKKPDGK